MEKNLTIPHSGLNRVRFAWLSTASFQDKGQALIEFTLCFILFVVVAWIPADFGLAFYTGHLASNAAREGARIGSATRPLGIVAGVPTFNASNRSDIATETCRRLSSALLKAPTGGTWTSCSPWSNAGVDVQLVPGSGTCNQMVQVTVSGTYNYFFYQLLHLMGVSGDLNSELVSRQATMRWEHQDC